MQFAVLYFVADGDACTRNFMRLIGTNSAAAIACQVREHLLLAMPDYVAFFGPLRDQMSAMAIAWACNAPAQVIELGRNGLNLYLCEQRISRQPRTIEKVHAQASQDTGSRVRDGLLHHTVCTGIYDIHQHFKNANRVHCASHLSDSNGRSSKCNQLDAREAESVKPE